MSTITKPKRIPKPKKLSGDDELELREHQELLDWLWTNLEAIVPDWISIKKELIDKWRKEATDNYRHGLESEAAYLAKALKGGGLTDADKAAIATALARFGKSLREGDIPPVPDEMVVCKLVEKVYQAQLLNNKKEVVGYVDAMAKVSLPSGLHLPGEILRWPGDISPNELAKSVPQAPEWWGNREISAVFFDVRARLPVTAVLLQELRVLDGLARNQYRDPVVAIVVNEMPASVGEIVEHEGFWVLEREDFQDEVSGT